MFSRSIHAVAKVKFPSFLWLSGIPLCMYIGGKDEVMCERCLRFVKVFGLINLLNETSSHLKQISSIKFLQKIIMPHCI